MLFGSASSLPGFSSVLFADVPTWTDREVFQFVVQYGLLALVTLVGVISAGMWKVLKHTYSKRERDLERKVSELTHEAVILRDDKSRVESRLQDKTSELERLREERLPRKAEYEGLQQNLVDLEEQARKLMVLVAVGEDNAATRELLVKELQANLGELRTKLEEYDYKIRATANRVRHALKLEGLIWEERKLKNAPKFRSLAERKTPIISVLNLKGGVGKTTITACLANAYSRLGYRVLLIDLDLQGSLTGLHLTEEEQTQFYTDRKLIQNFLERAADEVKTKVLDFACPVLENRATLVPTADTLAYTELNLTFKWLLRMGSRDPRFLLRKALHLRGVTNQFDVVLLDCPPLMTASCVNALAASDYVFVPVMPSRQATKRVPPLLKVLKSFRDNINEELKVLGVLANRTHRSEMTGEEARMWSWLRNACKDQWGEEVYMCDTTIRQSPEIRAVEDERRSLNEKDELYSVFIKLAEELERRLPKHCVLSSRRALVSKAAGS